MSRGVNRAIIIGNLGQDPELRHMPSGGAVTNISVATSESWKDKNTGQEQVRTEWHKIIFFNRLAEIAAQYLKKGSKVYVSGSLRTRKWTDQQGVDKYSTEIVASELQMLDGKQGGGQQGHGGGGQSGQQSTAQDYRAATGGGGFKAEAQAAGGGGMGGGFGDFEDDVPFLQHERGSVI